MSGHAKKPTCLLQNKRGTRDILEIPARGTRHPRAGIQKVSCFKFLVSQSGLHTSIFNGLCAKRSAPYCLIWKRGVRGRHWATRIRDERVLYSSGHARNYFFPRRMGLHRVIYRKKLADPLQALHWGQVYQLKENPGLSLFREKRHKT